MGNGRGGCGNDGGSWVATCGERGSVTSERERSSDREGIRARRRNVYIYIYMCIYIYTRDMTDKERVSIKRESEIEKGDRRLRGWLPLLYLASAVEET